MSDEPVTGSSPQPLQSVILEKPTTMGKKDRYRMMTDIIDESADLISMADR